jgi:hypothetical protein
MSGSENWLPTVWLVVEKGRRSDGRLKDLSVCEIRDKTLRLHFETIH